MVHNTCPKSRITNSPKAESKLWNSFENSKNGLRQSGTGRNRRYYSWDYTHNEIEVFDAKGNHLGALDPSTGDWAKPAVKGRKINVK